MKISVQEDKGESVLSEFRSEFSQLNVATDHQLYSKRINRYNPIKIGEVDSHQIDLNAVGEHWPIK